VIALLGSPAHSGLPHEDEAGYENRFECEQNIEKREWKGIEVRQRRDGQDVPRKPNSKDDDMQRHIGKAANKARHAIAELLALRALGKKLLLVFCDEVNVFLQTALGGTRIVALCHCWIFLPHG
jgi:hypothetical protein